MNLESLRKALFLLLVLSCVLPIAHVAVVRPEIESLSRTYNSFLQLLPLQYLTIRLCGELSFLVPISFAAGFLWSFYRPAHTRRLLDTLTILFLLFAVFYCCFLMVAFRLK